MKTQKIKLASKKKLLVIKLVNVSFAEKLVEKYRTVRLWGQFGALVFRKAQKGNQKSDGFSRADLSKTINNNNWFVVKEYKPVINLLAGKKEQIHLQTIKEKSIQIYANKEKIHLVPVVLREKLGERGAAAETQYNEFVSPPQIISYRSGKYQHEPSRIESLQYTHTDSSEKIYLDKLTQPDIKILQQNSTSQEITHLHNNRTNIYTNLNSTYQHIKIGSPLTFANKFNQSYIVKPQNRNQNGAGLSNLQQETLIRTIRPKEYHFINKKFTDITQLSKLYSNIHKIDRKTRVQTEETQHNETINRYLQLISTNIKTETLQKELKYLTTSKVNTIWEKQNQTYFDSSVPMTIYRRITGEIPKSKDSGLILYKPKQQKPPVVEEYKSQDILARPSEVYTQAVTSSKPAKISLADNPEEVSLIAEKVYGIIEKRLEIQKDRRGLR